MTNREVRQLHNGDEVFWNDPDGGLCSRHLIIHTIEFVDEDWVRIRDQEGGTLECFIKELE